MHTVIMVNDRFVRAADFEMAQVLSLKEALACEVIELHEAINALREDYENLALGYLSLVDRTSSDAQHGASASSKALQNEPDDQAWSALLGQPKREASAMPPAPLRPNLLSGSLIRLVLAICAGVIRT